MGGSHFTKLITGFVRLDKWMRGFEETDASQYNMDEDRAGARKMIFSKRSGRHKTNSFKGVRNNQVLNQTKISTDPSWQGLPYDDSKFIGWRLAVGTMV